MSNNLILCSTVLQTLIAREIIRMEGLEKNQIELFYYTAVDNEINQAYYSLLGEFVDEKNYFYLNKKVFQVLPLIKRLFYKRKYDTVYLASIDSPLIYFILSFIRFNRLVTFDDGTANIVKTSIYYFPSKGIKVFCRDIFYFLLGNRYSLKKIKKQIANHYTIYQGISNISDKTTFLDLSVLFKTDLSITNKKNHCIVILGTVFSEVTNSVMNKEKLKYLLQQFIDSKNEVEVIYIPHPRDNYHFNGVTIDSRSILAEEKIIGILNMYNEIFLYGFCSSTQFNLMSCEKIINFYFTSTLFDYNFLSYLNLAQKYLCNQACLDFKSK